MAKIIEFNCTVEPTTKAKKTISRQLQEYAGEYIVCDDAAADNACRESIEESLWSFNADFLAGCTGLDSTVFEAIQKNEQRESNNPQMHALVKGTCGIDHLVEQAIAADGRGYFLSSYDGEEIEFKFKVRGKLTYFYAYRTN